VTASASPALPAGTGGRDPSLVSEQAARREIVETCRCLAGLGLGFGRAGNVSLRWHRGGPQGEGVLVTPAALRYESMGEDDIVWMPLSIDEEALHARKGAAGGRRPSSEWRMHRDLHRSRPDCGAVVHVHSPAATSLACLPRIQAEGSPAFHYMVAVAGGPDIRCAPYRSFGTAELSEVSLQALEGRKACLLANHGSVALGRTLADALELAVELESLAGMYAQALQIGEPVRLGDDEIERVLQRFAEYRNPGVPASG
jgi:L-fuculose-phosphate aldolase